MAEKELEPGRARADVDDDLSPTPSSPVLSAELDDNYALYKSQDALEIDSAEAKRVLRKIDIRLVPILFVTYLLQYLDKNGINYASVYGLKTGTHLVGQDYSWLGASALLAGNHLLISSRLDLLLWLPRRTMASRLLFATLAHRQGTELHNHW